MFQKARESVQSEEVQNRLRNVEISHAIEKSVYIESEKSNKNLRYDNQGNETIS